MTVAFCQSVSVHCYETGELNGRLELQLCLVSLTFQRFFKVDAEVQAVGFAKWQERLTYEGCHVAIARGRLEVDWEFLSKACQIFAIGAGIWGLSLTWTLPGYHRVSRISPNG